MSPVDIWMERGKAEKKHLFDPYTGTDLGETIPPGVRTIDWLVSLHDDLLGGFTGRTVNGVGAVFLTVLCVTGAIIWWPGTKTWRRSLNVQWNAGWKAHELGSAQRDRVLDVCARLDVGRERHLPRLPAAVRSAGRLPRAARRRRAWPRAGDVALEWLAKLHFGRFAGVKTKALWAFMGLIPPALFVTGALMWWNRVLRPVASRRTSSAEASRGRTHGRFRSGINRTRRKVCSSEGTN